MVRAYPGPAVHTKADFDRLRREVWGVSEMTRPQVLDLQNARLRKVVRFANEQIPYYRERFAAQGVDAAAIRSVGDLPRLPIFERRELQEQPSERLRAPGLSKFALERSSGSSGAPVEIAHAPGERLNLLLVRGRTYRDMAAPAGDIVYVGLDRAASRSESSYPRLDGTGVMHLIDCRQSIEKIHAEVLRLKPTMLTGYVGVLAELAGLVQNSERDDWRPTFVAPGGEVLTPEVRKLMGSVFRAPVRSTYACTEAYWMGGDCAEATERGEPHYHINDDSVVVEVVDEEGLPVRPGQRGRVVITSLNGLSQPLIRYAIGDLAIAGSSPAGSEVGCPCGAPYSTLAEVFGRELDYLVHADGTPVQAYNLSRRVRDAVPTLRQYQLEQTSLSELIVRLVCSEQPSPAVYEALRELVAEVLGDGMKAEIVLQPALTRQPSGKFRVVSSTPYAQRQTRTSVERIDG